MAKCLIDENGRECACCRVYKEWDSYTNNKSGTRGKCAYCKECASIKHSKFREDNKELCSIRAKEYRIKNAEEISIRRKEKYKQNAAIVCSKRREYYKNNKDTIIKEWRNKYYEDNKESIIERQKQYYQENREAILEQKRNISIEQKKQRSRKQTEYAQTIAKYSTYGSVLGLAETVACGKNDDLIVSCKYCGELFTPTIAQIRARVRVLNGVVGGSGNLYCSQECKEACPILYQKKYPKGYAKKRYAEEVDPYLRQSVFKRDGYTCQKCGKHKSELGTPIHAHHIIPKKLSPIETQDKENLITLCKKCHIEVHTEIEGCGYGELSKCNK